ncbi:hypothetical protein [Bosea massiliensis]|uniref:Uncharacterized protein n=1 Tax=Bosea massiliensis TaxID=151419 RepID=A0ABW0PBM1_9HYPH
MTDLRTTRRFDLAVEAAAIAFHDELRDKKFLRWETSTEEYRNGVRQLVRPAAVAAIEEFATNFARSEDTLCSTCGGGPKGEYHRAGCELRFGQKET